MSRSLFRFLLTSTLCATLLGVSSHLQSSRVGIAASPPLPPPPVEDTLAAPVSPSPGNADEEGSVPESLRVSDNPTGRRQIVGRDERAPVLSRDYPWSAIGRLEHVEEDGTIVGICTGTLISKDIVLTNAHCVVDSKTNRIVQNTLRFRPNVVDERSAAEAYVVRAKYGENGKPSFGSDDWALLKLDRDLGSTFGTIGWRALSITELKALGSKVRMVGYSVDFPRKNPGGTAGIHIGCRIVEATQSGFLRHNCDTNPGSSGGPLLAKIDDRFRIIALHAGTLGRENRAILVSRWSAAAREMR